MAIELLEAGSKLEVSHQLYHDYESLFWVSLWAAMKTETVLDPSLNGKIREAVSEWETGEPTTIANRKEHILTLKTLHKVPLTPRFEKLYPFLHYFAKVLANAMFQANQLRSSRRFRSTERYRNEKRSGGRAVEAHDAWTDANIRDSIKAVITEYYASLEESTEGDDAQESARAGGGVGMGEGALSAQ
ncbi:hypothetical protein C8Q77DRAFT_1104308 [Trametes polyzona]|nr:hypothetical protein C8Q77DRAFT_1104308 [Trametes polyzona]